MLHDTHPETAILYLVLKNEELFPIVGLEPEDFELWEFNWREMLEKKKKGESVQRFKTIYTDQFHLEQFLLDHLPIVESDLEIFVSHVRDQRILRETKQATSVEEVLKTTEKRIVPISLPTQEQQVSEFFDRYAERKEQVADGFVGIKTGYSWIDTRVMFDRSQLITVAARPKVGKSTFSLNLALNMAKNGYRVLFLALEMKEQVMTEKALANITNTPQRLYTTAAVEDIGVKCQEYLDITKKNLVIVSPRNCSTGLIERMIEGFDVVVVDQLSKVQELEQKGETKAMRYGRTTNRLKEIAMKKNIAVIMCAQINREGTDQPTMMNLKDSGSIEEDSDIVLILHPSKQTNIVEVLCAANRGGEGEHSRYFLFDKERSIFRQEREIPRV